MKAKRSPVTGPLLTFALMVASVVAVVAVSRMLDAHQKPAEPTVQPVAASASDSSHPVNRE